MITSRFGSARGQCNENGEKLTIHTALDPDISVLIAGSTVTGVEESGVWLSDPKSLTISHMTNENTDPHIGIEVTVMVLPDSPGD